MGVCSDVGSWTAVAGLAPQNPQDLQDLQDLQGSQGNRSGGDTCNVYHLHFRNIHILATGNCPVAASSAQDLLIIDTLHALLVAYTSK